MAVDREVGSPSPASAHSAKGERFLKNLSSHTVHSAECTGNCTEGLMSSFPLKRSLGRIKHAIHLFNRHWLDYIWILRFLSLAIKAVGIEAKLSKLTGNGALVYIHLSATIVTANIMTDKI